MYSDKGTLATISRFNAVASVGRVRLSGFLAWLLWLAVHLIALTGFKNRVAVLFNWTVAFLGRGRQQRTITTQQVFARQSLESQAGQIRIPSSSRARKPANHGPIRTSKESHAMTTRNDTEGCPR